MNLRSVSMALRITSAALSVIASGCRTTGSIKAPPISAGQSITQDIPEPVSYQKARDAGTAIGYVDYLARFPDGAHVTEVRRELQRIRCLDTSLTKTFPSWIKKGSYTDPQVGGRMALGETYIGIAPSNIGYGYKASSDAEPGNSLIIEWRDGYIIHLNGSGIIVGPDGTSVLVGYDCK